MRDLFDNFDLDDEIPDFDNPDAPKEPLRDSAGEALALSAAMLGVGVELRRLLNQATGIIKDSRGLVLELAELLIAKKVLSGAEIAHVLGTNPSRTTMKRKAPGLKDEPTLPQTGREAVS